MINVSTKHANIIRKLPLPKMALKLKHILLVISVIFAAYPSMHIKNKGVKLMYKLYVVFTTFIATAHPLYEFYVSQSAILRSSWDKMFHLVDLLIVGSTANLIISGIVLRNYRKAKVLIAKIKVLENKLSADKTMTKGIIIYCLYLIQFRLFPLYYDYNILYVKSKSSIIIATFLMMRVEFALIALRLVSRKLHGLLRASNQRLSASLTLECVLTQRNIRNQICNCIVQFNQYYGSLMFYCIVSVMIWTINSCPPVFSQVNGIFVDNVTFVYLMVNMLQLLVSIK